MLPSPHLIGNATLLEQANSLMLKVTVGVELGVFCPGHLQEGPAATQNSPSSRKCSILPENFLKPLSSTCHQERETSPRDFSPNHHLSGLQTNTLGVFAVLGIKLSVVLVRKWVGERAEEFSTGKRYRMDNSGNTNSCKWWDKVCGVEFPLCLSCSMGNNTGREGEFRYYDS